MPKTFTDRPASPASTAPLRLHGQTMGTTWSVLIDDPAPLPAHLPAMQTAFQTAFQAAVNEVDSQMSNWNPESDLMRLNAAPTGAWVSLPDRLMTVLAAGLALGHQTGNAFDMNVAQAVTAWGFGPAAIDLAAIRAASAAPRIAATAALHLDPQSSRARKSAPVSLDLSGIAKGYGVDRLAECALDLGLSHALCAIDGEVRAIGGRRDGQPWSVGIDAPDDGAALPHSVLSLQDMAVATSGDYRHYVTLGAARLSHTIDPQRGAPLLDAPASVTVLSRSCMAADAMATALMVMGGAAGHRFAIRNGLSALFLLRQADGLHSLGSGVFA